MGITEVTVPKQYVLVQTTEPTGAFEGQLWYDSSEDLTYIFQDDDWQLITLDISKEVLDLATENAQQQIDIIELQANASVAPFDHDTLLSDTFNDADGYKDSVNTGNTDAEFDTNLYKRQNEVGIDLTTSLVGYYKLDEESGTTVTDSTETANGTNTGATVAETGKLNTGYEFVTESNSNIDTGRTISSASGISYNVWVYLNELTNDRTLAIDTRTVSTQQFALYVKQTPTVQVGLGGATSSEDLETGQWYMLTATWTGDTTSNGAKLYINGVLKGQGTMSNQGTGNINFAIGKISAIGNNVIDCFADEIGVWTKVLSTDEITYLYNTGSARAYEDFVQEESSALRTVEIDLPTVTGTVTHTELVTNSTIETGASITYKLNNGTTDDTEETPNTKNAYNLTGVPTKLKILLNPKEESPTSGNPSITSYCLKLWKA